MTSMIRLSFEQQEIQIHVFADDRAFSDVFTDSHIPVLVLGDDSEGVRAYYGVSILPVGSDRPVRWIGIVSECNGVDPNILLKPANSEIWVGFNRRVVVVDALGLSIRHAFALDSLFRHFLPMRSAGLVVVIHEAGLQAFTDGGEALWSVATDVIAAFEVADDQIQLRFMDDPPMCVEIKTGRPTTSN